MKKILHVVSSPRGRESFSIKLGNAIVEKLKAAHPDNEVETYDLTEHRFPHLEESHLTSFFTPAENRTQDQLAAAQHSEDAIQEVVNADIIVIGAPVYNFGIHSALKSWIDHIVRAGITFKYGETGPQGLIGGKKVYIAISSGAVFSEGPYKAIDFVEPYLRAVLGFIGLTDVTVFRVEGTGMPELKDVALEKAIDSVLVD